MNRVILQVPVSKDLHVSAKKAAEKQGFSSLQEMIRVILHRVSEGKTVMRIMEADEYLSPQAERRYARIIRDIKKGKNITKTKNLDELFATLDA